jgi:hypothetical protein
MGLFTKDTPPLVAWGNHPKRLAAQQNVARCKAAVEEVQARITQARRLADPTVDGPDQVDLAEAWKARRELPGLRDAEMAAFADLVQAERAQVATDEELRRELTPALRQSLAEPLANLYAALRRVAEQRECRFG